MKRFSMIITAMLLIAVLSPTASASPVVDGETALVPVSGTVTDAETGASLADVCVAVRDRGPGAENYWDHRGCTAADGSYAVELQPGRYEVQFTPLSDAYGSQWWPRVNSPVDAEIITVRRGTAVTGIDAALPAGAVLTGRAIEGATGQPMRDVCVDVYAVGSEERIQHKFSAPAPSRWEIAGLPPAEITVRLSRCSNWYRHTWAYDAITYEDATTFQLEAGETTDLGRFELVPGATLRGTVTSRRGGEPLADIVVADRSLDRSGEPGAFSARTAADGTYLIEDVQPGTWYPSAYDSPEWPGRPFWGTGWAGGARDPRRADPTVIEPASTVVVDFRLDEGATIKGILPGATEWVAADAYLRRYHGDRGYHEIIQQSDVNPETDKIILTALPATKLLIRFRDPEHGEFYFDGARGVEDATLIKLRPGRTTRVTAHFPGAR